MSKNKKGLYLITQHPPAIQVYKIQNDGTPLKGETITGKGLGSLGAAEVPSQSGDTPFTFSPDGLFLYNFSDADKSIGWCKVSEDGSLTYVDSCDVAKSLGISDVKVWNANEPVSVKISPDGKYLYTLTTSGGMGLFKRDLTTGGITYVSNAVKEKFEVKPLSLAFAPDGKTAYFVGKGSGSLWWWSRNPDSGMLAPQGKVALPEGTKPCYMLFDDVLGTIYLIGLNTVQVFSTR
jgi:6-phosphogluconolactonase (cycloisomerase 2 family)